MVLHDIISSPGSPGFDKSHNEFTSLLTYSFYPSQHVTLYSQFIVFFFVAKIFGTPLQFLILREEKKVVELSTLIIANQDQEFFCFRRQACELNVDNTVTIRQIANAFKILSEDEEGRVYLGDVYTDLAQDRNHWNK
jgi:hypothetical protein